MGEHQVKRPAVFLDRDGVLNAPLVRDGAPYPPRSMEEFRLLDGVKEACERLKKAGFVLVVATNQPDVGRGTLERSAVEAMHAYLAQHVPLDRIEVCYAAGSAHGEPSERRKPAPGMLHDAASALNLDLSQSWMVGDRWRDISCGHAAGCRTVLVDWRHIQDFPVAPDFTVPSLAAAADLILRHHQNPSGTP